MADYLRNARNLASTKDMQEMYDRHLTAKLREISALECNPDMERLRRIAASARPGLVIIMVETRGVA